MAVELKFETQRGFEIRWEKRKKILSSNLDMHANAVKIFCRKKQFSDGMKMWSRTCTFCYRGNALKYYVKQDAMIYLYVLIDKVYC